LVAIKRWTPAFLLESCSGVGRACSRYYGWEYVYPEPFLTPPFSPVCPAAPAKVPVIGVRCCIEVSATPHSLGTASCLI